MASYGISYTLNGQMFDRLLAEQKRFKRTRISPDMFAKELLLQLLEPNNAELLSKLLSPEGKTGHTNI